MSASADLILERRQIRRRLTLWRILAIMALIAAVVALIPQTRDPTAGEHVARLRIEGIILDDPKREAMLETIAEDEDVKALILHINSPGGTVAASEALYDGLRRIGETRPIVAVMSEAAASGGYIAAMSADHIVARSNTLTGSIGVVAEIPNFQGLMETLGVGVTRVKSAPLKAEPNITEPPDAEVLAAQRELVEDSFDWFRGLVRERRGLDAEALAHVTDGRAFTGRQALENGLVDALGGEVTARNWLETTHGIDPELEAVDYDWTESPVPWPASLFRETAAAWLSRETVLPSGPRLYAVIH